MTFTDRVAAHFRQHPREWISAYVLMNLGGKLAFRTRISNCRTRYGMTIDNRLRYLDDGEVVSEYIYYPLQVPTQATLFEAHP